MTPIRSLAYPYRLRATGSGHWARRELSSSAPLTRDGIRAYVRYADAVAARYAYLASRWGAVETDDGLLAEVLVYVVDGDGPAREPRHHPGNERRFTGIAEVYLTDGDGGPVAAPGRDAPVLWAREPRGGALVPVSVHDAPQHGCTYVSVQAVGAISPGQYLTGLGAQAEIRAATAPLPVSLHRYRHRTLRRTARRAAAGRGRPDARALIGTLEQFGELRRA